MTTKLWNTDHGYQDAVKACESSLKRLGLDYVDLYLMYIRPCKISCFNFVDIHQSQVNVWKVGRR